MIDEVNMGRYCFRVLIISTMLWGSCSQIIEEKGLFTQEGSGISVRVNKPLYGSGEPISMTLRVFNHADQQITFSFRDARRYDFTIEDEEGQAVWRWSHGRMFAQVLGEETLGSGREEVLYSETYTGMLKAGEYKVTGILVASQRAISASITITIR